MECDSGGKVMKCVRAKSKIEIDLVVELFNLGTYNFYEQEHVIFFFFVFLLILLRNR